MTDPSKAATDKTKKTPSQEAQGRWYELLSPGQILTGNEKDETHIRERTRRASVITTTTVQEREKKRKKCHGNRKAQRQRRKLRRREEKKKKKQKKQKKQEMANTDDALSDETEEDEDGPTSQVSFSFIRLSDLSICCLDNFLSKSAIDERWT